MASTASILEKLSTLPPEKQCQVLDYIDKLHEESESSSDHPRSSMQGQWKELTSPLSAAELRSVRDELWGRFPRVVSE